MILQNSMTISGQKALFSNPGVFQDQGQIQGHFQVCANPGTAIQWGYMYKPSLLIICVGNSEGSDETCGCADNFLGFTHAPCNKYQNLILAHLFLCRSMKNNKLDPPYLAMFSPSELSQPKLLVRSVVSAALLSLVYKQTHNNFSQSV